MKAKKTICCFCLSFLFVIMLSGCNQSLDTEEYLKAVSAYMDLPADFRNSGTATTCRYVDGELSFSISEIEEKFNKLFFEKHETGTLSEIYIFKEKVDTGDYEKIVDYITEQYGEPTFSTGLKYMWRNKADTYKLVLVYDSSVFNNAFIGINRK